MIINLNYIIHNIVYFIRYIAFDSAKLAYSLKSACDLSYVANYIYSDEVEWLCSRYKYYSRPGDRIEWRLRSRAFGFPADREVLWIGSVLNICIFAGDYKSKLSPSSSLLLLSYINMPGPWILYFMGFSVS